ncbi:MAG: phosphatidylglycerophosphatase A [Alphaproteobacteria bacterium]
MTPKQPPAPLPLWHPACLLATWFGTGLLPKAPGTWGALAALPFAWVIHARFGLIGLAAAAVGLFAVGWWAASVYGGRPHESDPGPVVIDEVAGQWLTLLAAPLDWRFYAAGFLLFRAADIAKPWPVRWAERRLKGGLGVMLDDALAAAYAAAALYLLSLWMR